MYWNQELVFARLQLGGVVLAVLCTSLVLRRWLLSRLDKTAKENPGSVVGQFKEDLRTPTLLWCLAISIDVLLSASEFSVRVERIGHNLVVAFLILSLTIALSSFLTRSMHTYGERKSLPFAVAGLSRTLARATVFSVGLLVLLGFLGIDLRPVLAALGVGGLAVALALQDTLANLFAGVHILVEQPISVGDYVRLSAEEEGTVSDIGWRTTRLVTGANSMVVIPNKTITSGNLLNYSMPSLDVGVWVPIVVGLDADMAKVEKIALQAAAAAEGVLASPPPILLADPGMTPTHLQYRLAFRVPRQTQGGGIRTQVVNRILEGFRREGIPLPDPRARC
ncbi:MAG TPA: mechanosensitive ion channel family protein [Bryobacteraceae bacterium]|nr:mechanosensitive ion channel family protein [Bryobacteraceae bacterium]